MATHAYFYVTADGTLGVAHYWEELRFVDDLERVYEMPNWDALGHGDVAATARQALLVRTTQPWPGRDATLPSRVERLRRLWMEHAFAAMFPGSHFDGLEEHQLALAHAIAHPADWDPVDPWGRGRRRFGTEVVRRRGRLAIVDIARNRRGTWTRDFRRIDAADVPLTALYPMAEVMDEPVAANPGLDDPAALELLEEWRRVGVRRDAEAAARAEYWKHTIERVLT